MTQPQFDDQPPEELTIGQILENRAVAIGDDICVTYGPADESVTYEELDETANRFGNALAELGIERQEKVSLMISQPLETLFTFFGLQKAGAIYSPINDSYKGSTLSYQINDTRPRYLVLEDRFANRLNEVKNDLETLPHVILYETDADATVLDGEFERSSFDRLFEGAPTPTDRAVEWDDIASVLYTSGTTGDPKGVVQQHRWVIGNYAELSWRLQSPEDVTHTSLPLYHVGGLYSDIFGAIIAGASVVVWDEFSPSEFWNRVERYEPTRIMLLSSMIQWLANQPEREDDHRNTLSKVTMVPIQDNYEEIAKRFGWDLVFSAYGSTEIGSVLAGIIHAAKGDHGTPHDLVQGMAPEDVIAAAKELEIPVVDELPGDGWIGNGAWKRTVDLSIVDERDETVPPGEVGELVGRPTVPAVLFQEYDGKPNETVESWQNLWFHTGDAMYRDEQGNYYFVDRIGTVIRRRGENISSGQVQDIVNTHPDVEMTAAFPVPADEGGEDEVAIAVELADASYVTKSEISEYLEKEMPEFMIPRYIHVVDTIPTTPTNKMEKYKLREDVIEREDLA